MVLADGLSKDMEDMSLLSLPALTLTGRPTPSLALEPTS